MKTPTQVSRGRVRRQDLNSEGWRSAARSPRNDEMMQACEEKDIYSLRFDAGDVLDEIDA